MPVMAIARGEARMKRAVASENSVILRPNQYSPSPAARLRGVHRGNEPLAISIQHSSEQFRFFESP